MNYKRVAIILLIMVMLCGCEQSDASPNTSKIDSNTSPENTSTPDIDEFKAISKPELEKKEIVFNRIDTEGNILDTYSSLVGFNNDDYYFSYKNNDYWLYAIGNNKSKEIMPIYKVKNSYDIFYQSIYKDNLIIGIGYWETDTICRYELLLISTDGEKKTVYESVSRGFPTTCIVDDYAVINLVEQNENLYLSKLLCVDLESEKVTNIETSTYTIENNLYSGTFTINAGGWKNGFCYEKVTMNKEEMQNEQTGKSSIYYYSFKNKKSEKLVDYSNKVFYINGSNACFVTSDYLLKARVSTGKIWIKEQDGYKEYEIPGIVAGEDIKNAYQLTDDTILLYNRNHYYIYSLQNKSFYKEKYEFASDDPDKSTILSICAYENQFAYIKPDENMLILNLFNYNGGA